MLVSIKSDKLVLFISLLLAGTTMIIFQQQSSLVFMMSEKHCLRVDSHFLLPLDFASGHFLFPLLTSRKLKWARSTSWGRGTGSPPGCSTSVLRPASGTTQFGSMLADLLISGFHAADERRAGRGRHSLH